jgi:hypothetical protein
VTTFTDTWDATFETLPPDTGENASQGASRIRRFKTAVQERGEVDHSWAGDADDGKHKKVTLLVAGSDPTLDAGDGGMYAKVVNGVLELFYIDDQGTVQQITSVGKLVSDWTTGDVKVTLKIVADAGWVMFDDGTLGDASSGATTRANADTEDLFTLLWTNAADAQCPVSTGRGVSAAADFAAHKTIALPTALGRAIAVAGAGSGLTSRALAEILGSEDAVVVAHTHTNTLSDPGHVHDINVGSAGSGLSAVADSYAAAGSAHAAVVSHTTGITINNVSAGSSGTDANSGPRVHMNIMVKL